MKNKEQYDSINKVDKKLTNWFKNVQYSRLFWRWNQLGMFEWIEIL